MCDLKWWLEEAENYKLSYENESSSVSVQQPNFWNCQDNVNQVVPVGNYLQYIISEKTLIGDWHILEIKTTVSENISINTPSFSDGTKQKLV